jgi:methyl-accepting chemotaxis protein
MEQAVQQNAAVVEQAAAAAESMRSSAQRLYDSVSAFKLDDAAVMPPQASALDKQRPMDLRTTARAPSWDALPRAVPTPLRDSAAATVASSELPSVPASKDGEWKEF